MTRVVMPRRQADLFATGDDLFDPPSRTDPAPAEALAELERLVAEVRAATVLPFVDAAAALAVEFRVESLARQAGPGGAALATAFQAEMERLYAAGER